MSQRYSTRSTDRHGEPCVVARLLRSWKAFSQWHRGHNTLSSPDGKWWSSWRRLQQNGARSAIDLSFFSMTSQTTNKHSCAHGEEMAGRLANHNSSHIITGNCHNHNQTIELNQNTHYDLLVQWSFLYRIRVIHWLYAYGQNRFQGKQRKWYEKRSFSFITWSPGDKHDNIERN